MLNNQTIEAMDAEISRLLVEIGLASRNGAGELTYDPDTSNPMLIVIDDNGSPGSAVKLLFDMTRAKGSACQTGVCTPLIVAGPLGDAPYRDVTYMTNIATVYELFGEIAGINVH